MKKKFWYNSSQWPKDCLTQDFKIQVQTISGELLICLTKGFGYQEINNSNNNCTFGLMWVNKWRFIETESEIQTITF